MNEALKRVWLRPELVAPPLWVAAIILIMLGPGAGFGIYYGLTHSSGDFVGLISDRLFLTNATIEAPLLGLFLLDLHRRGWRPADLRLRLGWLSTAEGLGLLIATYIILIAVLTPGAILSRLPHAPQWLIDLQPKLDLPAPGSVHLSWWVIISFTFLNAFYEELVYMSFTFNQVAARLGPNWAVATTVLIRILIHTYQGESHVTQIGTWALVFGLAYRWRGKVWPLVLAHACIDLLSLGALKIHYG